MISAVALIAEAVGLGHEAPQPEAAGQGDERCKRENEAHPAEGFACGDVEIDIHPAALQSPCRARCAAMMRSMSPQLHSWQKRTSWTSIGQPRSAK